MKQGELTPTLKLRRAVIESRFAEQISAMYADPTRA
jgi:long-subunit acyl-CoA synthetase (AMP-forming)